MMMMSIQELMLEHEKIISEVSNDWVNHAFETCKTGINKEAFDEGISWLYQDVLKMPKPAIIYCDTWEQCLYRIATLSKKKESICDRYFTVISISSITGHNITDILSPALSNILIKPIEDNARKLMDHICHFMKTDLMQAIPWDAIRPFEWKGDTARNEYCTFLNWSNYKWVSHYDYFETVGIYDNPHFIEYKKLLRSGVFNCYVYEKYVFAIQPPLYVEVNTQGSLHSVKRAALELRDGSKRYCINGRNIAPWIVECPDLITKEKFLSERNVDNRGAMYEILGQEKIMAFLGVKEIGRKKHKCRKPIASDLKISSNGKIFAGGVTYYDSEEEYILYESACKDPQLGILKWVHVICPSTATSYLLSVSPFTHDPVAAVAATFRLFLRNYLLDQTS